MLTWNHSKKITFGVLASILLIIFACSPEEENNRSNDTPSRCPCDIELPSSGNCEDTLATLCPEPNQIYNTEICQCTCLDASACGSDCDNTASVECENGALNTSCACICEDGYVGPSCDQLVSAGGNHLYTTIEFEDGTVITYNAMELDHSFSNSLLFIDAYNDDEDSFIYIQMLDLQGLKTNVDYPIIGEDRIATVKIPQFNGEIWANIPGIDPGFLRFESLDFNDGTFKAVFEFPISSGTGEVAWVRNGLVYSGD